MAIHEQYMHIKVKLEERRERNAAPASPNTRMHSSQFQCLEKWYKNGNKHTR